MDNPGSLGHGHRVNKCLIFGSHLFSGNLPLCRMISLTSFTLFVVPEPWTVMAHAWGNRPVERRALPECFCCHLNRGNGWHLSVISDEGAKVDVLLSNVKTMDQTNIRKEIQLDWRAALGLLQNSLVGRGTSVERQHACIVGYATVLWAMSFGLSSENKTLRTASEVSLSSYITVVGLSLGIYVFIWCSVCKLLLKNIYGVKKPTTLGHKQVNKWISRNHVTTLE